MPTCVTHNTETLLDHVYVTSPHKVIEVLVPKIGLSDHLTTCITYSRCNRRDKLKKGHVSVKYRDININLSLFFNDLSESLSNVHILDDNVDLNVNQFSLTFIATVNMRAPLRENRVKRPNQPDWFNDVIRQEILKRDLFLKSGNT